MSESDDRKENTSSWRTASALFGSLIIGVVLSAGLLALRDASAMGSLLRGLFPFILITGAILAGPGLLILSGVLLRMLRSISVKTSEKEEWQELLLTGTLFGTLMSYMNFPGYLGLFHLTKDPHPILRLIAVYTITGMTCGIWIAWQVFQERHPGRSLPPRVSDLLYGTIAIVLITVLSLYALPSS